MFKDKVPRARHLGKVEHQKLLIGCAEWCALPDLNVPVVHAKVDTGAKTSAIHAFNIRETKDGRFVRFDIHPLGGDDETSVSCKRPIVDVRSITSSNGQREMRYVIQSRILLGDQGWDIELTLSKRDEMKFRMLLGQSAMKGHVIIDPARKDVQGKLTKQLARKFYT